MRRSRSVGFLSLCLVCACHHEAEAPAPPPVAVKVAKVTKTTVFESLTAAGPLAPGPGDDVKMGALVTGRLSEVLVAEGDKVQKGQVLAKIESTTFRDALAQAEAQLKTAQAHNNNDKVKLDRAQKSFTAGIVARQEVDDAQAQFASSSAEVRSAQAAVSTAQNQVSRTQLRAPFDGMVAHVFAAAGEPVDGSGKPVIEVARTEALELRAVIPANSATRLHAGQKATLNVSGGQRKWEGEVLAVSPLLDAQTGTATVRVKIANADGSLKGGEMAQARIVLSSHAEVLAVPESALVPSQQTTAASGAVGSSDGGAGLAVETVDPKSQAVRKDVVVGVRGDGLVEVNSGLQEGETVIVQGAYALPDGAPVKVEDGKP